MEEKNIKIKKEKKAKIILIFTVICFTITMFFLFKIRFNFSASEPLGMYYTEKATNLKRNDRVILSYERFQIKGYEQENVFFKPNDILKSIRGVEGDRVIVKKGNIYVNGENFGKILTIQNVTPYFKEGDDIIIPKGKYLLLGRSILSFDSRYLGFFEEKEFQAKAILLLKIGEENYVTYQNNLTNRFKRDKEAEVYSKKAYEIRFKNKNYEKTYDKWKIIYKLK